MSPELSAFLFLALCAATAALYVSQAISRAVSWLHPCDEEVHP